MVINVSLSSTAFNSLGNSTCGFRDSQVLGIREDLEDFTYLWNFSFGSFSNFTIFQRLTHDESLKSLDFSIFVRSFYLLETTEHRKFMNQNYRNSVKFSELNVFGISKISR